MQMLNVLMKVTKPWRFMGSKCFLITTVLKTVLTIFKSLILKWHSANCTCENQFTCHGEQYSAVLLSCKSPNFMEVQYEISL